MAEPPRPAPTAPEIPQPAAATEELFAGRIPLTGGSLPDAVWTKTLGLPSFLVSYGDPLQANHSPNESYAVTRFWQGIQTSAALLAGLATDA